VNEKISDLIILQLKNELPKELEEKINEFENLVGNENYRAAFAVLEELKRIKGWSPSSKLLGYYEKFWWELAN
jgi:hypothetical protein